jgi:hypothetical protein
LKAERSLDMGGKLRGQYSRRIRRTLQQMKDLGCILSTRPLSEDLFVNILYMHSIKHSISYIHSLPLTPDIDGATMTFSTTKHASYLKLCNNKRRT